MNKHQAGFTIVELVIVMLVSSLLIGVISGFALNYWGRTIALNTAQSTLISRLNAGDYLRNDINSASGLITQNNLADPNVGAVDPADGTGTHWLIIHAIPTTITNGASGSITPLVYYNRPSVNSSKQIIMNGASPYEDNIVLYLDGTSKQLLARTIANGFAPSNRARTSCPKALVSSSCPADIVVAENVANMRMRYFSRSGNPIDYTSITDPLTLAYIGPDYSSVEIVEFTLNLFKKAELRNAADAQNQTVIRVALRN